MIFKTLVNTKARCSKCEGYENYDYQYPSKSQDVRTMPNNDVDESKVVEDIHVPPKTASIIKDKTVDFSTPIFDEIHVASDSTGDDVNEIPAVSGKSFEFPCVEYNFMIVPIESYSSEPPEFLAMIQQMISSASFFTNRLEFISESNLLLAEFEACHTLGIHYLSFSHR